MIHTVPGKGEEDLSAYRTRTQCDHCKTARRRTETYVIRSQEGEVKQIGKNCLADFLRDPGKAEQIVKQLALWQSCQDALGDGMSGDGGWGTGFGLIPIGEYLILVLRAIRRFGFLGNTRAKEIRGQDEECTSTCERVQAHYTAMEARVRGRKYDEEDILVSFEGEEEEAAVCLSWGKEIPSDTSSEYLNNLRLICQGTSVKAKHLGYLASLPTARDKALGVDKKREGTPVQESKWLGQPGGSWKLR
jgi:ribosomal protein L36